MKNLRYILLLLVFSSCSTLIMNQGFKNYKSPIRKSEAYNSANQYQKDLLYLNDLCENSFPLIDATFPDSLRNRLVDSLFSMLSIPVSENQFAGYMRYYLSHYQNQHTWIGGLQSQSFFPYALHPRLDGWYLSDINHGYDSSYIGLRVTQLNGAPIEAVESQVFKYIFAENLISKRNNITELIRRPDLLKQFGVISQKDSIQITFENVETIWVKSVTRDEDIDFIYKQYEPHPVTHSVDKNYDMSYYPNEDYACFQFNKCFDFIDARETIPEYVKPWVVPFARWYLSHLVKKGKNPKNDMGFTLDMDRPVFKDYLEASFDSLNRLGINNLIIDLRNNGGGSSLLCLQLLYHLTDKRDLTDFSKSFYVSEANRQLNKKDYKAFVASYHKANGVQPEMGQLYPYGFLNCDSLIFEQIEDKQSPYFIPESRSVFRGKIIVLANAHTGSAAALFTAILQDNNVATIIGTSVGNNPIGATNLQPFKLPESKVTGSVATGYLTRPKPAKGPILQPEYWVENDVSDLLYGGDKYLEKALEMMNEK